MNATLKHAVRLSLLALAAGLVACAAARPPGSPPDTDLYVTDEGGSSLPGEYQVWSPKEKDSCSSPGAGCAVNVPEGEYNLSFTKMRGGRMAQSTGGSIGGERSSGCLRSRVHLVPGKEIHCKKVAEYSCAAGAVETMDCGDASVVRAMAKPAH